MHTANLPLSQSTKILLDNLVNSLILLISL